MAVQHAVRATTSTIARHGDRIRVFAEVRPEVAAAIDALGLTAEDIASRAGQLDPEARLHLGKSKVSVLSRPSWEDDSSDHETKGPLPK